MRARKRRGRPRNPTARRRATTTAGRRAPDDPGSPELRWHRVLVTTRGDLPDDLLGALYGRGIIEETEYDAGRAFADLVRLVRRGLGLGDASPAGTWRNILAAAAVRSGGSLADVPGAERARRALLRLQRDLDGAPWDALSDAADNQWPTPELFAGFLVALHVGLIEVSERLPRRARTASNA